MNGNLASIECDNSYIPNKLTYYVTESVAKGTGTTETLKEYKVDIKGAIVACGNNADLKLVNLYKLVRLTSRVARSRNSRIAEIKKQC